MTIGRLFERYNYQNPMKKRTKRCSFVFNLSRPIVLPLVNSEPKKNEFEN